MNDKILFIIIKARDDADAAFEKVNAKLDEMAIESELARKKMDGLNSTMSESTKRSRLLAKAHKEQKEGLDKMAASARTLGIVMGVGLGAGIASTAALGVVAAATFAVMGAGLLVATAAVIGLGVYGIDSAKTLKSSFHDALTNIKTDFKKTVEPFMPEMTKLANQTVSGIQQAFKNFSPAITDLLNTMDPVFSNLTSRLGNLGTFASNQSKKIIDAFGSVSTYFTGPGMTGLGNFVNGFDDLIADLIKIGGPMMGPVFSALGQLASQFGSQLLTVFNNNKGAIEKMTVDIIKIAGDILAIIPQLIQFSTHFSGIIDYIANHKWVIDALIAGFVAVKTAMLLNGAAQAFTATMLIVRSEAMASAGVEGVGGLTNSLRAFRVLAATPIVMPAILIAAAVASLVALGWAVANVIKTIKGVQAEAQSKVDATTNAAVSAAKAYDAHKSAAAKKALDSALIKSYVTQNNEKGLVPNAAGTNYWQGGSTLVGEQGPEIVNLPKGSQVIPNKKSEQMLSGSTVNIYGNISLGSKDAVEQFFNRLNAQRTMSAYGVGV